MCGSHGVRTESIKSSNHDGRTKLPVRTHTPITVQITTLAPSDPHTHKTTWNDGDQGFKIADFRLYVAAFNLMASSLA